MDVHALGLASESFDLVVALGVLPWLHSPAEAMREMGRVLRPGGWWVGNVDNALRLDRLLDPARNPLSAPLLASVHGRVARREPDRLDAAVHTHHAVKQLLDSAGIAGVAEVTYGFGPLTFLKRPLLPETLGRRINRRLTELALRGAPFARMSGSQLITLGQKRLRAA